MNQFFTANFFDTEVSIALFQMNLLNALGPDEFLAHFFQKHWPTIKKEVCCFVLNVLNHNASLDDVNSTFITIIPEIKYANNVGDFRPSSLCNVIYKIVAKVLANRLQTILPIIIFPNQCVFVSGRLIIDYIIIAYETLHPMITKGIGNNRYMTLKLGMSKA